MKQRWKIAIPVGIIIVPFVIFLFFRFATTQHYNPLPKFGNTSVSDSGTDTLFQPIPDFSLLDQNGKTFTRKDLKGKTVVVNILSTSKPDAAKLLTQALSIVNSYYPASREPDLRFVTLTADPDFDSPETLKKFAQGMEADVERWFFLTGNKAALYAFATKGLLFEANAENKPFSEDYTFRLIDKDGYIRGMEYDGLNQKDMDKVIDDIKALKWEYNHLPN